MLLADLEHGRAIDARALRDGDEAAFGGSDAEGAWDWKTAYEACEAAQILFLRKFGPAMRGAGGVACRVPRHARQARGAAADADAPLRREPGAPAILDADRARLRRRDAAAITPADLVLEPSAGTGLLAILAELAGARLSLNELAETRADLLGPLFPGTAVTRHDAAQIDDHLDAAVRPTVVLMNPPFSAAAHVEGRVADAALRHISSALARLADGGRLVAITGASLSPDNPAWREASSACRSAAASCSRPRSTAAVYARHGTTVETRLTVIDKRPRRRPGGISGFAGHGARRRHAARMGRRAGSAARADARLTPFAAASSPCADRARPRPASPSHRRPSPARRTRRVELAYETLRLGAGADGAITDALYEGYALQSIRIPGREAASDTAGAVGGHGLGRAAQAGLSPASAAPRRHRRPALRCPARKRHLCRRGPCGLSRGRVDRR